MATKTKTKSKKMTTKKTSFVKKVIAKIKKSTSKKLKNPTHLVEYAVSLTKLAEEKGVTTPYFSINGGIVRKSDGYIFNNGEEFFKDGGAEDYTNVTKID